jgi:carbon-monoxide dehydrogenase small subunit
MLVKIKMTVNGMPVSAEIEPRVLLVDFIRDTLRLTGTHIGCDTAQCGACTIHMNGNAVKCCNMLAVQGDGATIVTIEGIARPDGTMHPMQAAFRDHHGLQCGYCTPGMVMSAIDLVKRHPHPSEAQVRAELDGNLCRCTGYHGIVEAVLMAPRRRKTEDLNQHQRRKETKTQKKNTEKSEDMNGYIGQAQHAHGFLCLLAVLLRALCLCASALGVEKMSALPTR